MTPPSAYADPLAPFSAGTRARPMPQDTRQACVLAVAPADLAAFPEEPLSRFAARNTPEAIRLIERWRPRVAAIDWDLPEFDGVAISAAARQVGSTAILVTTAAAERAPAALRAGCHAVLLKPFAPNLLAARMGRLCREMSAMPASFRAVAALQHNGTNRTWPDIACPTCGKPDAVGFEFSSHRRSWYACLSCDSVWLGPRRD